MRTVVVVAGLIIGMLVGGVFAFEAHAVQTISILDVGQSGVAGDGTIFEADPNPTLPATGTGVFQPFLRIGAGEGALVFGNGNGQQLGFNTDKSGPGINFDTKDGSSWTRSVQFGELGTITRNGTSYYVLSLDANEQACATCTKNQITIEDMQIFIGGPNLQIPEDHGGLSGTPFDPSANTLAGVTAAWTLDKGGVDTVDVILQASICDATGQCGSGHGDLGVFIPVSLLGTHNPTDYFVLYTEYSGASDGFEEWRIAAVPEPATLLLLGSGLIGLGLVRRFKAKS